jgi:hypothetical protein
MRKRLVYGRKWLPVVLTPVCDFRILCILWPLPSSTTTAVNCRDTAFTAQGFLSKSELLEDSVFFFHLLGLNVARASDAFNNSPCHITCPAPIEGYYTT